MAKDPYPTLRVEVSRDEDPTASLDPVTIVPNARMLMIEVPDAPELGGVQVCIRRGEIAVRVYPGAGPGRPSPELIVSAAGTFLLRG